MDSIILSRSNLWERAFYNQISELSLIYYDILNIRFEYDHVIIILFSYMDQGIILNANMIILLISRKNLMKKLLFISQLVDTRVAI